MRDAGRELADHRELAGLHQLVLCAAQRAFGLRALGHFLLQQAVGRRQVGGALGHLAFQFVMRFLQRALHCQPVFQMTPPLVQHQGQDEQESRARGSQRGPVERHRAHLRLR